MPVGRLLRQDNVTGEKMTAKASHSDTDLFNAMTSEALAAGALPDVKAANEAGAKKLFQLVDEDAKAVAKAKPKSRPNRPENAEEVKPKGPIE